MSAFLRAVQMSQAAAQGFYLPLVRGLLTLGMFENLEHLFHIIEALPQRADDLIDLLDGILKRRRRGGDPLWRRWRRNLRLNRRRERGLGG